MSKSHQRRRGQYISAAPTDAVEAVSRELSCFRNWGKMSVLGACRRYAGLVRMADVKDTKSCRAVATIIDHFTTSSQRKRFRYIKGA